jgi:hypothetical protein
MVVGGRTAEAQTLALVLAARYTPTSRGWDRITCERSGTSSRDVVFESFATYEHLSDIHHDVK